MPGAPVPARGVRADWATPPRGARAEGLSRGRHGQPHAAPRIRPARLAGQRRGAARRASNCWVGAEAGLVDRERLYPRGRRRARPRGQPQVRPEARLPRADDALGRRARPADADRRRFQRRPARMRRLRPQGAAQGRQPHPDRGRDAAAARRRARLGRSRPPAHPRAERNYSWWSYRSFWREKDQGRRLDHMWASPELARQATGAPRRRGDPAVGAALATTCRW